MDKVLPLLPIAMASSALAIGLIVYGTVTAIGRNPEATSKMQTPMIMGLAFAEAISIYALVIALLAKFV